MSLTLLTRKSLHSPSFILRPTTVNTVLLLLLCYEINPHTQYVRASVRDTCLAIKIKRPRYVQEKTSLTH